MADLNCSDDFHRTIDHFLFQDPFFEEQAEVIRINDVTLSFIEIMLENFEKLKNFVKLGQSQEIEVSCLDCLMRSILTFSQLVKQISTKILPKAHFPYRTTDFFTEIEGRQSC